MYKIITDILLTNIAIALSLALLNVMYAEYDGPPLPLLYTLFVLITIFSILPY